MGVELESQGPVVERFFAEHLRYTKGRWRGKPFQLRDWQVADLHEMFRLREDGLRKYRTLIYGTPRKAGKSEMAAGLGVFFMVVDDEPGAEVYSCAGSKDQAKIVFSRAKTMVELSPTLSQICRVYKDVITVPETGAEWRVVSAEAYTSEGLNPSAVIFDELHVQPNRELWDVMTLASGAREQPFVLGITTAGADKETLLGELYDYGLRVESGEEDDAQFFFKWYGLTENELDEDPECWRDEKTWARVHPAYGDFFSPEFMAARYRDKPRNVFIRYMLNCWVEAAESWLPAGAWEKCNVGPFEFDKEQSLFTGTDASTKLDSTAHVMGQWNGEKLRVKAKIWERPLDVNGRPDPEWRIPQAEVEAYLRDLNRGYSLAECAYDPQFMVRTADILADEGLPLVEIPQSDARMVPACQAAYDIIVNGDLEHDGDPVFARHVRSAVAVIARSGDGGWRLKKGKAKKYVDAAIALALMIVAALAHRHEPDMRVLGSDDEEGLQYEEDEEWDDEVWEEF